MSEENRETYTKWQHEREMTRIEIDKKRWFIAFMVIVPLLIVLLVGSNLAWVIYENQFQDVQIEQFADSGEGGDATIYGAGIGDVKIVQSETDDPDPGPEGER